MSFSQKDLVKMYKSKVVKPPGTVDDETPESIKSEYACKLDWLNLHAPGNNLDKIEQRSAVENYTYIFEQMFPGLIGYMKENCLRKVPCNEKWHILLTAMDFLDIRLPAGIQWKHLLKGQLKDNFKFLKWFQIFHDINKGINDQKEKSADDNVIVEYMEDDEDLCQDIDAGDVFETKAEMEQTANALNQKREEAKKTVEKLQGVKKKLELTKEKTSGFRFMKQNDLRNKIKNVEEELRQKKEDTEHIRGTFLSHTLDKVDEYRSLKEKVNVELDEILQLEKDVKNISALNWCYKQYLLAKIRQMREDIGVKAKVMKWLESRQDMVDMGKVLGADDRTAGKQKSSIEKLVCDYCDPKLARALGSEFSLQ